MSFLSPENFYRLHALTSFIFWTWYTLAPNLFAVYFRQDGITMSMDHFEKWLMRVKQLWSCILKCFKSIKTPETGRDSLMEIPTAVSTSCDFTGAISSVHFLWFKSWHWLMSPALTLAGSPDGELANLKMYFSNQDKSEGERLLPLFGAVLSG